MKVCVKCQVNKEPEEFSKRRSVCKKCRSEDMANQRKNNPERTKDLRQKYYYKNRAKIRQYESSYRATEKEKQKRRIREAAYRQDPIVKLKRNYSNKIRKLLKQNKSESCYAYLGCTFEEFKIYLESLFKDGMSWKNYGPKGWHIDHIIPLSSALTKEEVVKLSHYTNLQPLWWLENLIKGEKMLTPMQK